VGVFEGVTLMVDVVVIEEVPVPVLVGVGEGVGVGESVGVTLLEKEVLEELEGDTPVVKEAVGDKDSVEDALIVEDGVSDGVLVDVPVEEPVGVDEGVTLLVVLLERDLLPVFDGDTPFVRDAVGDADTVLLGLNV
jgi:hypothetical protein